MSTFVEYQKMKSDVSKEDNDCLPSKRKSERLVKPVPLRQSGKGLPYAPVDWPNPGDIWGWRVGSRIKGSGFYHDRFLYAPQRLQEKPNRKLMFYSKPHVMRYLASTFPEADIDAFFESFNWEIPAEAVSVKKGKWSPCPESDLSGKARGKMKTVDEVYKRIPAMRKRSQKSSEHCAKELVLDISSEEEQTLASGGIVKALESSQVSDSQAAISPNHSPLHSPIDSKPQSLNTPNLVDEPQTGLVPEDFDRFLNSLDEILSLPLPKPEVSSSSSSQGEGKTKTRAKLSSLLAMGYACLATSNKLYELTVLTTKLKDDPTLGPGELSMLELIEEIPVTSNSFLEAKKLSGQADKFFADLNAKVVNVASLRNEYNDAKKQLEASQAEEASALLAILEIDEQISALQERRATLTQKVKATNKKIVQYTSNQKRVMECLPKIVHEVQVANSEKQEWELKKKKSAEQEAEILAKFALLDGFSF
ncbi:hypothetical protein ACH5RR_031312 [Cinchona calisaya]|uniref:DUF7081 domain-containing protein n=1 Tax=Cinchona calisaya TaxID=153742 RepID=A0ABD2YJ56_9GENT